MLSLVLLSSLIGCGAAQHGAEVLLSAATTVTSDVFGNVLGQVVGSLSAGPTVAKAEGDDLDWETTEAGGKVSGTLKGNSSWKGAIDLEGDYTDDLKDTKQIYGFGLALGLSDVKVDGKHEDREYEVTMNGPLDMEVNASYDLEQGSYAYKQSVQGNLSVDGSVDGDADFDYSLSATWENETFDFSAEGMINGHEVSMGVDIDFSGWF